MHEEASISASTPASAPEQNTRHGIRFSVVNTVTVALSVLFAIGLFITASAISSTSEELQIITDEYIDCENSAIAMKTASDYLSTQARMFGVTSDPAYLRRYLIELYDTKGREHSVQQFNARSQSESAKNYLASAMQQSEKLVEREKYAMKLIVVAEGIPPERGASELDEITLTAEDAALAPSDMLAKATALRRRLPAVPRFYRPHGRRMQNGP